MVLAALLTVAGGTYALVGALSAEPWVRYALRLESAPGPLNLPEPVRDELAERISLRDPGSCDWDIARSRVTIVLDLLRRSAAADAAPAQRDQAARDAVAVVREGLLCNAADANLWYLLALLEYRASSDWGRTQPLLRTSALLSPFEGDLLLKRAQLAALALSRPEARLDLDVASDLRRAMALAPVAQASAVLGRLRDAGRGSLADELVVDLPAERLESLAGGTNYRRSTFGKTERYRHFDYEPFGAGQP
ncbi:hypothetical protein [Aureimonas phyllosphaerae]|uniref:Uncharacterized protein n=1 Tax=Aureimonas phyllosphaerae TaxID=1166078 RepID=A0A7W6BW52_9HYPH|nr:hypothetical protein [Aureimonas phyllosphaerae]MBB3938017.1 hypothetical protein [Aureimonas phyllosphaerae]MBB3962024.1 hypothetical protein [Aureimonas phyllosphaerae]